MNSEHGQRKALVLLSRDLPHRNDLSPLIREVLEERGLLVLVPAAVQASEVEVQPGPAVYESMSLDLSETAPTQETMNAVSSFDILIAEVSICEDPVWLGRLMATAYSTGVPVIPLDGGDDDPPVRPLPAAAVSYDPEDLIGFRTVFEARVDTALGPSTFQG